MVAINKKLTPYNFTFMSNKNISYIVIHYVGAVSTAKNNVDYYAREKLQASAHYFVDEISIWQSVEDKDRAWHCGGGLQGSNGHKFHGICTNSNSIGIEMCCKKDKNGNWYFEPETVKNTIDLVKMLMAKHNIPIDRVIRHFDVTGKNCPAPYVNESKWQEFKSRILTNEGDLEVSQYKELKEENKALKAEISALKSIVGDVYKTIDDVPEYYKPTIKKLVDEGAIKGTAENNLNLPEILVRTLVVAERSNVV